MPASYENIRIDSIGQAVRVHLTPPNGTQAIGWQFYDPESGRFIMEGEWVPAGPGTEVSFTVPFPPEAGDYRVYISPISESKGWAYAAGSEFLIIDVRMEHESASVIRHEITTVRALSWRRRRQLVPEMLAYPVRSILSNRRLIASMARRDILARYRGSLGDVFWTVLNPLILMATYFFVFGVVLRTRFGADQSSTGFALYFLAGMLPWLAFSEAAGRAPHVIVEHRSFVKKLIFPLETLPVNQVVAGLISELFATAIFIIALLLVRHSVPSSALWLPVVIVPQVLFTLGMCWFLAALGVFFRDLGQIMGFVLTLWFFITPICYPETSLPSAALPLLTANPIFILVRAYRAVLLENHAPNLAALSALLALGIVVFLMGHAFFYKLRKTFADVI